jgi:hypothetical protein
MPLRLDDQVVDDARSGRDVSHQIDSFSYPHDDGVEIPGLRRLRIADERSAVSGKLGLAPMPATSRGVLERTPVKGVGQSILLATSNTRVRTV